MIRNDVCVYLPNLSAFSTFSFDPFSKSKKNKINNIYIFKYSFSLFFVFPFFLFGGWFFSREE